MSIQALSHVLEHSRSTGGARCVLIALANHDGDGGCWPTVERIAWEANLSPRAVQRHLKTLEVLGEIRILRNRGGNADWDEARRPNLYRITITAGRRTTRGYPQPANLQLPNLSWGDTSGTPGGDTIGTPGGDTIGTQTVHNNHPNNRPLQPSPSSAPENGTGRAASPAGAGDGERGSSIQEIAALPQRHASSVGVSSSVAVQEDQAGQAGGKPLPDNGFAEWWELYPRKVGKQAAAAKYAWALKSASAGELLDGLRRHLPLLRSKDPQFVPHPATWLSQGRWEDEVGNPPPQGQKAAYGQPQAEESHLINIRGERVEEGGRDSRQIVRDDKSWFMYGKHPKLEAAVLRHEIAARYIRTYLGPAEFFAAHPEYRGAES